MNSCHDLQTGIKCCLRWCFCRSRTRARGACQSRDPGSTTGEWADKPGKERKPLQALMSRFWFCATPAPSHRELLGDGTEKSSELPHTGTKVGELILQLLSVSGWEVLPEHDHPSPSAGSYRAGCFPVLRETLLAESPVFAEKSGGSADTATASAREN